MVGGSGSLLANTTAYEAIDTKAKLVSFTINPNIGYFFANKFAGGLNLSIDHSSYTLGDNKSVTTSYLIGPYARYYFLSIEKLTNLFLEGNYQHNLSIPSKQSLDRFLFFAGPAFYFNESVGLEVTIGYSVTTGAAVMGDKSFRINIGFQIHLEKEK
jgi:hypothetical protein